MSKRKKIPPGTIIKYPNRRLYCTKSGGYITLKEVHARVVRNETVIVIDKPTEKDITCQTYLDILSMLEKCEQGRVPTSEARTLLRRPALISLMPMPASLPKASAR